MLGVCDPGFVIFVVVEKGSHSDGHFDVFGLFAH